VIRADQCSSQSLEFLRVTEQREQGNNHNEVAGRGYLEFRPPHNENEEQCSQRARYEAAVAADELDGVSNTPPASMRLPTTTKSTFPVALHARQGLEELA